MEFVTNLRELWHRRILVGLVAFAAIVVGLLLSYRLSLPPESRKYDVGIATSRILVDTPTSQVVEVQPKGSETLGARASLIANLMAEGEVKAAIARRAGLRSRDLIAVSEAGAVPPLESSTLRNPKINLLTTRVIANSGGEQLPIMEIEAQAPDSARAATLATAAVTGLRDYLDSKAAMENASDKRRLRVVGLGPPQARVVVRGPGRVIAIGVALFIFLAGCTAILLTFAIVRSWRAAAASERADADDFRDLAPIPFAVDPSASQRDDLDHLPELSPVSLAADPSARDGETEAKSA